jgi:hypothetical protein
MDKQRLKKIAFKRTYSIKEGRGNDIEKKLGSLYV